MRSSNLLLQFYEMSNVGSDSCDGRGPGMILTYTQIFSGYLERIGGDTGE